MNKQNKIIVGVVALILALTIGYAVFSQSLNIKGTAKAEATNVADVLQSKIVRQDNDAQKLAEIIKLNNINSITVVRMQVPCCGGLEHAAKTALQKSGKSLPFRTLTVTADGTLLP